MTTTALRIGVRRVGYRQVIQLDGELDGGAAELVKRAFWDAVECGARDIWLDLSNVTATDRAGVQAIGALGPACHELNRTVRLVGAAGPVRAALHERAVDEEIPMFPTLAAAQYEHPDPE